MFAPGGRVLVIASGGDTALRLAARGFEVTAVDSNPAQIDYVLDRLHGGPARPGRVERMQALTRKVLVLAGWQPALLRQFCAHTDPQAQLAQWHADLNTRRFRALFAVAASPSSVRAAGFAAFTARAALRFDVLMRTRVERGLARHANRDNPFIHRLLLGAVDPLPPVPADAVRLACADVVDFLEASPAGQFDGISLSNVLDAATPAQAVRLHAAVRRATRPGAILVTRSFRASPDPQAQEWAIRDRSLLWGGIDVHPVRH